MIPSWNEDTGAWDSIIINGYKFEETLVEVDGDFGNDFDVKKAPGADGATLTNKGVEPIKPTVKWLIYDDGMWELYQQMLAQVYPYPGKTPLPLLEVIHPQLQLLKKAKFRLVRVHTLKKTGPQIMQAQFDLLEYFAEPKKIPAPSTTTPTAERTYERALYQSELTLPSNNVTPL